MKNIIIMLLMLGMLAGTFSGCAAVTEKEEDAAENAADLGKAQQIELLTPDGEALRTLTDEQELAGFIAVLEIENWVWTEQSEKTSEAVLEIVFSQQPTAAVFGSSDPDRPLEEIARMTVFADTDIVSLTIAGFTFYAQLPEEAASYLRAQAAGAEL